MFKVSSEDSMYLEFDDFTRLFGILQRKADTLLFQ